MNSVIYLSAYLESGSQQGGPEFDKTDPLKRKAVCLECISASFQDIDFVVEGADELLGRFVNKSFMGRSENRIGKCSSAHKKRLEESSESVGNVCV